MNRATTSVAVLLASWLAYESNAERSAPSGLAIEYLNSSISELDNRGKHVADLRLVDADPDVEPRISFYETDLFPGVSCSGFFRGSMGGHEVLGIGTLNVRLARKLDYESQPEHTMCVTVWDEGDKNGHPGGDEEYNDGKRPKNGWWQTTTITITVLNADENANEAPGFSNTMAQSRIYENADGGTEVCCNGLRATDKEDLWSTLDVVLGGEDANSFYLSQYDFVIAAHSMDYETKRVYNLTASVTDSRGASASYSFSVGVVDIIDESCSPPAFRAGVPSTYPPTYGPVDVCVNDEEEGEDNGDSEEGNDIGGGSGGDSGSEEGTDRTSRDGYVYVEPVVAETKVFNYRNERSTEDAFRSQQQYAGFSVDNFGTNIYSYRGEDEEEGIIQVPVGEYAVGWSRGPTVRIIEQFTTGLYCSRWTKNSCDRVFVALAAEDLEEETLPCPNDGLGHEMVMKWRRHGAPGRTVIRALEGTIIDISLSEDTQYCMFDLEGVSMDGSWSRFEDDDTAAEFPILLRGE